MACAGAGQTTRSLFTFVSERGDFSDDLG